MKKIQLMIVGAMLCLSQGVFAVSIPLYQKLEMAADSRIVMTPLEMQNSMRKTLAVMTGCQMDELCVLIAMKHLSDNEDNLLYIHFYNRLFNQKADILYSALRCQNPALKDTRKVMANCLASVSSKLSSMEATERMEANGFLKNCTLNRLASLGKAGNVFAQAKMLEYELSNENEKGINYWYNKINRLMSTQQYQVYTECSGKF